MKSLDSIRASAVRKQIALSDPKRSGDFPVKWTLGVLLNQLVCVRSVKMACSALVQTNNRDIHLAWQ